LSRLMSSPYSYGRPQPSGFVRTKQDSRPSSPTYQGYTNLFLLIKNPCYIPNLLIDLPHLPTVNCHEDMDAMERSRVVPKEVSRSRHGVIELHWAVIEKRLSRPALCGAIAPHREWEGVSTPHCSWDSFRLSACGHVQAERIRLLQRTTWQLGCRFCRCQIPAIGVDLLAICVGIPIPKRDRCAVWE
jgi:hypothetical protein